MQYKYIYLTYPIIMQLLIANRQRAERCLVVYDMIYVFRTISSTSNMKKEYP